MSKEEEARGPDREGALQIYVECSRKNDEGCNEGSLQGFQITAGFRYFPSDP